MFVKLQFHKYPKITHARFQPVMVYFTVVTDIATTLPKVDYIYNFYSLCDHGILLKDQQGMITCNRLFLKFNISSLKGGIDIIDVKPHASHPLLNNNGTTKCAEFRSEQRNNRAFAQTCHHVT